MFWYFFNLAVDRTRHAVFFASLKIFASLGIIKVNFASALTYRKKSLRCGCSGCVLLLRWWLEEFDVGGLGFGEGLEVGLVGEVVLEVLAVAVVVGGGG